jgi:hypothetical protein
MVVEVEDGHAAPLEELELEAIRLTLGGIITVARRTPKTRPLQSRRRLARAIIYAPL